MEQLVLIIHVLCAVGLIGLVLLQQGKGATMGASFGSGASQTLFGASGSVGFLGKLTAVFAMVFFLTSGGLALLATKNAEESQEFRVELPAAVEGAQQDRVFTPGDVAEEATSGAADGEAAEAEDAAQETDQPVEETVPLLDDAVDAAQDVPAVD